MRRIVRNTLLVLVLVPAMVQSGIAKWIPRLCPEMAHEAGTIMAHSGLAHEHHAHHDPRDASGLNGNGDHYHLVCVGCDCPDAQDVMLVSADSATCVSEIRVYENLAIASVASIDLVPPTPPPRS